LFPFLHFIDPDIVYYLNRVYSNEKRILHKTMLFCRKHFYEIFNKGSLINTVFVATTKLLQKQVSSFCSKVDVYNFYVVTDAKYLNNHLSQKTSFLFVVLLQIVYLCPRRGSMTGLPNVPQFCLQLNHLHKLISHITSLLHLF
jgi:hypothetical protein